MIKLMIAGAGTDVGKTVVAAILTTVLKGDYWKPIECGKQEQSDTLVMQKLVDRTKHQLHSPAYSLKAPLSPHHAAQLENTTIDVETINLPHTTRPLIIEGVGGILVPLNTNTLTLHLFKNWECQWIVVSRHYLGSINHTLLTLEVLKQHQIPILGVIFNGAPHPESETVILEIGQLPCLGRVLPEQYIDFQTIQQYAQLWQPQIVQCTL